MGKGQIISGGTDGQYQVQVKYNRDQYDREVARLEEAIELLTARIEDKESVL